MSNRKTLDERIAAAKEEAEQKQSRLKLLLQQQKKAERKARNHRLCERGGKIEGLLPALAKLDDEQFQIFVEMCLLTNHTRKVLSELLPPDTTAEQRDAAPNVRAAGTEEVVAPKPPVSTHNSGANVNGKPADTPRAAS